jgi:hypothetical protein
LSGRVVGWREYFIGNTDWVSVGVPVCWSERGCNTEEKALTIDKSLAQCITWSPVFIPGVGVIHAPSSDVIEQEDSGSSCGWLGALHWSEGMREMRGSRLHSSFFTSKELHCAVSKACLVSNSAAVMQRYDIAHDDALTLAGGTLNTYSLLKSMVLLSPMM